MAIAAHPAAVEVATTLAGVYSEIDGINDFSFTPSRDTLDTTDFADTSGAHLRLMGLQDTSISISGDYEAADTNGQVVLRDAMLNGTSVGLGILFDGTDGLKVLCYVESFEISAGVEDKVEFSCELVSTGAVAVHS